MAELTQDAVLHFLQSRGGTVPNAELLLHFRPFLREHANRDRNRELFKKFVNSVARVKQEDGVSYVVLLRKYLGYVPGIGGSSGGSPGVSAGNVFNSPSCNDDKPRNKTAEVVPAQPGHISTKTVLPAAGIVLNNNNNSTVEPNLNLPQRKTQLNAPGPAPAPPGFSSDSRRSEQPLTALTPQPQPAFTSQPRPQPAFIPPSQPQRASSPQHVQSSAPKSYPANSPQPAFSTQPQPAFSTQPQPSFSTQPQKPTFTPQPQPAPSPQPVPANAPRSYPAFTPQPSLGSTPRSLTSSPLQTKPVSLPQPQPHMREPRPTLQNQTCVPPAHRTPAAPPFLQQPKEAHLPPALVKGGHREHPGGLSLTPAPPAFLVEAPITEKKLQHQEASAKPVKSDSREPPFQLGSQAQPNPTVRCPPPRRFRNRPSYRTAVSVDDYDDDEEEEVVVSERRGSAPLEAVGRWDVKAGMGPSERVMSQSTPVLDRPVPHIQVPGTEGHHGTAEKRLRAPSPSQPQKLSPGRTVPQIHVQDLDSGRGSETGHVTPEKRLRTPSPLRPQIVHGSCSSPSLEQSDRSHLSSGWSSNEELADSGGSGGRAQGSIPNWQRSLEEGGAWGPRAWHRSTGDLYDDGAGSSDGSTSSSQLRPAVARRVSSKLRSRMCMSVGADLDQLMQEDDKRALGGSEAARLNRLNLISSSLSLRHLSSSSLSSCSTPPRYHSLDQLTDHPHRGRRSLPSTSQPQEGSSRQCPQSQVPLEAREHMWLVKAAAGAWPDIYSLFREDPSLLHRQDFISGFTVLHWIAKHGDHRVLNTLWYGVEKNGMTFDTDAQSSCGYTPLHIAAMHCHKNIIRLLVSKFKANVKLRDASGRKAWFYLPQGAPPEIFQLLEAPPRAALGQTGEGQELTSLPAHQQIQKRRRRHHLSSASRERPLDPLGNTKVKRSSSLAAFLKHKSLHKVKAQSEWAI